MPDLHVRRYEPRDADAVWALHKRALRDIGAFDEEYAHLDADLREIEDAYLAAGGEFLVGEPAGDTDDVPLVAMGGLQPATAVDHHQDDSGAGVLRRMRVDPAHQRRGYGREMLETLESHARDLGFDLIVLDTTPRQTAAMALYESAGYAETRRGSTPAGEMVFYEKLISD